MKTIVCFIDDLCLGGAQRQLVGLASLLQERGYHVIVMTYHNDDFYKYILSNNNIQHIYKSSFEQIVTRIPSIAYEIRKIAPDVVISYQESPNLIACLSKVFVYRCKLLVSERNTTQRIQLNEKLRFFLYRFADAIIPNSHSQEIFLKNNYPNLIKSIHTITNFVDTDYFIPSALPNKNRIISVGRISPQKNILNYIRAAYLVVQNHRNIIFEWFGNTDTPEYEAECHKLIRELQMERNFIFREATVDVLSEYQQSMALCLPSLYEGFPNVICEAMSCGLPILCSNICDNPYIVSSNDIGFLFNPHDINNIAEVIVGFLNLPSERKLQMRHRCRNIAVQSFSKTSFLKHYIDLIEHD